MTSWPDLFGDELCTTSGGKQTLFPTDEHLSGKDHCLVVVAHEQCPNCPAFFSGLRTMKDELEEKGVGLVCVFQADTTQEHLRVAEKYGEVHIPTGFPTPPELLQKKRSLSEMIGKSVPSYAVFDSNHQVVVDVTTRTLTALRAWLTTLEASPQNQPDSEGENEAHGASEAEGAEEAEHE